MTRIRIKRVYEPESPDDGYRVLVDRLWPRGIRKDALHYDSWEKEVAPSAALRTWYHQDPAGRWDEFRKRYLSELEHSGTAAAFAGKIRELPTVTLLFASQNAAENHALILREYLETTPHNTFRMECTPAAFSARPVRKRLRSVPAAKNDKSPTIAHFERFATSALRI